jgi:hypothetical protein
MEERSCRTSLRVDLCHYRSLIRSYPAEKNKNKHGAYHRIIHKVDANEHHAGILRMIIFQHAIYPAQVMDACRFLITSDLGPRYMVSMGVQLRTLWGSGRIASSCLQWSDDPDCSVKAMSVQLLRVGPRGQSRRIRVLTDVTQVKLSSVV